MSTIGPELQMKISQWRLKAADGTLSLEEMKEAIAHLRAGRVSAAYTADSTKRKKAIREIPKADDLLAELDGL